MNPYESPRYAAAAPPADNDRDVLRAIVRQQRNVNLAILGQIVFIVFRLFTRDWMETTAGALIGGLLALALLIFSIVAILRLGTALYNRGVAIACAICMVIPVVSLIVLFSLNGQATKRARAAGLKVGLLGANPDDLA